MKKEFVEKIKDMGIGILFIILGIVFSALMIGWLIFKIFISSKGQASSELNRVPLLKQFRWCLTGI